MPRMWLGLISGRRGTTNFRSSTLLPRSLPAILRWHIHPEGQRCQVLNRRLPELTTRSTMNDSVHSLLSSVVEVRSQRPCHPTMRPRTFRPIAVLVTHEVVEVHQGLMMSAPRLFSALGQTIPVLTPSGSRISAIRKATPRSIFESNVPSFRPRSTAALQLFAISSRWTCERKYLEAATVGSGVEE